MLKTGGKMYCAPWRGCFEKSTGSTMTTCDAGNYLNWTATAPLMRHFPESESKVRTTQHLFRESYNTQDDSDPQEVFNGMPSMEFRYATGKHESEMHSWMRKLGVCKKLAFHHGNEVFLKYSSIVALLKYGQQAYCIHDHKNCLWVSNQIKRIIGNIQEFAVYRKWLVRASIDAHTMVMICYDYLVKYHTVTDALTCVMVNANLDTDNVEMCYLSAVQYHKRSMLDYHIFKKQVNNSLSC
jgi:hypothetical protein